WGIAAALQLAAAEGIEAACGLATLSAYEGLASEILPVREGRIEVPGGPGLGLDLRPEELIQ
nr:hypothetical protein [Thermoleophilaceae bacterium]